MRKAIPKVLKEKVKRRFEGHCGYCGQKPSKVYIDHIRPVLKGGDNSEQNLMPSCFSCNNYKISHDLEFFRSELLEQVNRARQRSINFRLAERFGLIQEIKSQILFYFEKMGTPGL